MSRFATCALLLLGAVALSGCVGVSMHSLHPTRVVVTDAGSNEPAANVPLSVTYDYDSYGWFKMFNVPASEAVVTDSDGSTVMNLADFRYRIILRVGEERAFLGKAAILEGAVVSVPPYKVVLTPMKSSNALQPTAMPPLHSLMASLGAAGQVFKKPRVRA